jgi:hypothetical protein
MANRNPVVDGSSSSSSSCPAELREHHHHIFQLKRDSCVSLLDNLCAYL